MENRIPTWLPRQLQRREWTQADFVRALSKGAGRRISTGLVSNWLTGERRPTPKSCELIADVLFIDVDEVLAIAGHRPRLPMDTLERIHADIDPYLRKIPWNEENRFNVISELERIIRVEEMRAATRTVEQYSDPVEVDEEE